MIADIPQPGAHWTPERWAAEARSKRCRIAWNEYCRLIDQRAEGRLVSPCEIDSAWELYLACGRDECLCVDPLEHQEGCQYLANQRIEDGFGSSWSAVCPRCHKATMQVVRPGMATCAACEAGVI